MATAAQSDPRDAILAHLANQTQLTAGARQFLGGLLQDVDIGLLQSPADLARGYASMDQLAAHLMMRSYAGGVDAQTMQMALRDLCPLFPIC